MRRLHAFIKGQGGTSAIEFAIIAPILAGLVVYGFDAWTLINRKQDMHAAVNASAHYYMGGGADDPTAQSLGLTGWPNKPGDAQMSVARACTCSGASSSCTTVCAATQQAPEIHITLTATTQWSGLQPVALSETENVRVR